ncbi:hypothetical protein CKA38_09510 [Ereboglobus luteus]|uniref:Beta-mannosidase-like galactose-binding domain-containing protein n=1 Tax=Ereboglobus luteus TaxID=1796921 RepID=A0A2U8E3T1_9BACT|nr:hypothetical protein CKA38_09510 [Ereboglobus luteus]
MEAMKEAGIAGATLFQLVSTATDRYPPLANNYSTGVDYFNAKWWELMRHTMAEAKRLGLELGMHNCIGWSVSGGPWIKPETAMQHVVWSEMKINGPRHFVGYLEQPPSRLNFYRDIAVLLVPDGEPGAGHIIDVSGKMRADGKLICEIPKGGYTIYRFGHTPTGAKPTSAPENIDALEADKMSAQTMTLHMNNVLEPLKKNLGEYLGETLTYMLFDSYEAGDQNWTPLMRAEFLKRNGYDIVPWLPVLAGRTLESKQATDGFKWDLKRTVSDMFIEYSYGIPKQMLKELGMLIQIEPYATGPVNVPRPFNTFDTAHLSDLPTTEFWTRMRKVDIDKWHVNAAIPFFGINILSAEAFTGGGSQSRWNETPAQLKFSGDVAFSKGVNRLILHHWVHQPFPDNIKPGMCMGPWGTHFGRNQTWYESGKAWIVYLSRSQYLLQKGQKVSDFISLDEYIPGGDVISEKTLLSHVRVENGKLVSPSGRKYHLLAVPNTGELSNAVLTKLLDLASQGATILGPKPSQPKGLKDISLNIKDHQQLASRIWGHNTQASSGENVCGKGKVLWGYTVGEALKKMNIAPNVAFIGNLDDSICWSHRQAGDIDIFYFSNTEAKAKQIKVSLRAKDKAPEIWDPESGKITPASVWQPTESGTDVTLQFAPSQALFVVFKRPINQSDFITSVASQIPSEAFTIETSKKNGWCVKTASPGVFELRTTEGRTLRASIASVPEEILIGGEWNVDFKSPLGRAFSATFGKLESWAKSQNEQVKYFSGTATYHNTVHLAENQVGRNISISLNLGTVKDLASITINGKHVAVLWHAPYEVDITQYIKSGENKISIAVTNTWTNRLIGDNNYTNDCEWGDALGSDGRALLRYPEWLINNQPRPSSNRVAFSSWNYFNEKSPLLDAGLLSEVKLQFRRHADFQ